MTPFVIRSYHPPILGWLAVGLMYIAQLARHPAFHVLYVFYARFLFPVVLGRTSVAVPSNGKKYLNKMVCFNLTSGFSMRAKLQADSDLLLLFSRSV